MKTHVLSTFLASLCLSLTSARGAIVYSPGPASQSPPLSIQFSHNVDLDADGFADYSFWSYGPICTMDYPSSFCSWPHYVSASGTNLILITGFDALLQAIDAEISSYPPPGALWGTPWYGAGLAVLWWGRSGQITNGQPIIEGGWGGPLANLGVAYVGVRLCANDGPHYGWIRTRLPVPSLDSSPEGYFFGFAPVVVDWAYETCPDKPIRAGDIGSAGESVQFTVEWSNPHRGPRPSIQDKATGSFILTGNTLRGELRLASQFSSAQIIGPGNPHKGANPVSDFGPPLVAKASHTAFFHEATLTHSQVKHLLHGKYCVTVDDGTLAGQILPAAPVHRARDLSSR
jgi:hypothetical protein